MKIKVFVSGPLDNNTYLVHTGDNQDAAVIDPAFGSYELILKYVAKEGLTLSKIFLTHSHFDHIADCAKIKRQFQAKIYIHKLDSLNLINPGSDHLPFFGEIEGVEPDILVDDNDKIKLGELEFLVLATAGHTLGSVCYYLAKEKILFSGDTLFKGTYGRVSFSNSDPKSMLKSLKRLASLPKDTKVFPGHGDSTTIEREEWLKNPDFV